MRKVKVYIASPYSNGDKEELVKKHFDAAYELLKMGFNPYAPLYCHFIQKLHPDIDNTFPWLEIDKTWEEDCDMVVRMHFKDFEGNEILSPGADEEQENAEKLGIPLFHFDTVEEMVRMLQTFETTIQ
jgi:hypothetical protein